MKFKFFKHTADVKFQAYGKTMDEAFANSALVVRDIMIEGLKEKIKEKVIKKIKVEGKDNESLLLNFLEEFLFLLDAQNFLLSKVKTIKIKDNKLTAEVIGDKASNYEFTNDVKAVTYSEMFVKKNKDKFICQVVLDV